MCLAHEKTVDHFLLNCSVAQKLWMAVLGLILVGSFITQSTSCSKVGSWSIYRSEGGFCGGMLFLRFFGFCGKTRNLPCFENQASSGAVLANRQKYTIASWVYFLPQFHGLSLDMIVHSWREVAHSCAGDCFLFFWSLFCLSSVLGRQPMEWLLSFGSPFGFFLFFPFGLFVSVLFFALFCFGCLACQDNSFVLLRFFFE